MGLSPTGAARIAGSVSLPNRLDFKFMPYARRLPLLLAASSLLLIRSAFPVTLPDDCMALSEIRIGMTGEARSVIKGFEPSIYKVEILGVDHGALPGAAMILAKVEGPGLEGHGIVAGMSGSPVYINGKIIGALAFGWSFSYHPIAGITPIEQMLTMWDDLDPKADPDGAKTGKRRGPRGEGAAVTSSGRGWDWESEWKAYEGGTAAGGPQAVSIRPAEAGLRELTGDQPMVMEPLSTPIFLSSSSPATFGRLDPFFKARGLRLFAGGGGAGSKDDSLEPAPPIVAGSTIGIPIMTGDMSVSGIGTVTYRRGDKLLAFGHPMMSDGASEIPMSAGYIFGYMQSYSRPFKLGETREIVGTITQDQQFAIGGVFGKAPERVPITVNVTGKSATNPRRFNFSAWEDREFLPQMAGVALMESAGGASGEGDDVTGECRYTVKLASGERLQKHLKSSARGGAAVPFFGSLMQDVFLMVGNPYRQADVESIQVDLDLEPGFRVDSLLQAAPRYTALRPGETVEVDLVLQPYRGETYKRRISVPLPGDLPRGSYVIHLADAETSRRIDQRHAPANFRPMNFEQTFELASRLEYPETRLRAYLMAPAVNLSLGSAPLEELPGSIETVVSSTAPADLQMPVLGRILAKQDESFDFPISARTSFAIEVTPYLAR